MPDKTATKCEKCDIPYQFHDAMRVGNSTQGIYKCPCCKEEIMK